MGKLGEGMTDHRLARPADDAAVGGIDVQADVVWSAERHADGGILERAPEALLAVAQRGFQPLPFADVEQCAMPGERAALLVAHEDRAVVHPDPLAIAAADAELELHRLARARGVFIGLAHGLAIVRVDPRQQRIKTGRELVAAKSRQLLELRTDVLECGAGARRQRVERDRQLVDERLESAPPARGRRLRLLFGR